jgi:hypothetical protein
MTLELLQTCTQLSNVHCYVPDKPIDFIALCLTVLAIVFAVKQYFDARELRNRVADLDKQLEEIKGSTSTHALPTFPDNVPDVCRLLDSCVSGTTFVIMSDFIGYTVYSAPHHFDSYLLSLNKAIGRGVKIRMLVYDYSRAKRATKKQFPSISGELDKERFAQFFKRAKRPLAKNEKEFYRALLLTEEDLYSKITGVAMKLLSEEPPALLWMRENPRKIVFGFRDEFPGIGFFFQSEDKYLCDQFATMFETHWNRAEDNWDCRW